MVNTCDVETKVTGWSYSINPVTALLTYAIPGVGAIVGETLTAGQAIACASSVSVMHQTQNVHQKTHAPTMMVAEDYNINVGNAYLKDTQIRGKRGKVHVEGDLKIEASRDEYSNDVEGRSYSSSLGFMAKNGKKAAVSLVTGTSRGVTDIHETNNRVNNFSALTAEDSFELEVGGNLEATSAYYGQKKLDEPVTAPRTSLDSDNPTEQIKIKGKAHHNVLEDEYSYKNGSYNASVVDLYQVVGAIKQTVFDNAIEEGATTEDAVKEVQKVENETREFLEKEEVKETVKEIKKINSELKKVEEKQKKLEEETPGLKTKAESENINDVDKNKLEEYQKLQKEKEELIREGLFATQFVYELTEDYADKHGWREEVKESLQQVFDKLGGVVSNVLDKVTGEKVEGMAVAKPFAKIALKAGAKTKAGKEFIKFLVKELVKQGFSQTKINEIMTELGADPISGEANTEGFDEYDGVFAGIFERRVNNDPRQMKFPFGDENRGSSSGNNRNDKGKEPERKPTNNENTEKQSEVAKITERKIGQSGKYEEMIDGAPFHDGNEAHHMPSQKWLKANGMNTKEGFSAIMSQKLHKLTRTNGRSGANIDTSQPYRSEIGRDLNEYVRILKDNKSWTPEVRENLMNGLDGFKKEFPDLFKKVMK